MKKRNGFVSNSSSSSFIIGFETKPKSKEELQQLLFGERKEYHDPYSIKFYSTDDVASTIWNRLKNKTLATKEDILEELERGYPCVESWFEDYLEVKRPEFKTSEGENIDIAWEKWEQENKKYCEQFMPRFFNNDKEYYILEFSDNEGNIDSAIEHGDAFDRLHPFQVSHH
jgi:hypothetical protein